MARVARRSGIRLQWLGESGRALVDVRSPQEFSGELAAPPGYEQEAAYSGKGVTADKEVAAYCRIGERSAHTWFVLHELLGYERVRNYDGSWTEWGNLVDVPIER